MQWSDVRTAHPNQWLVIEALKARSCDGRRVYDEIAVIERCPDGPSTMKRYRELRREHPGREFCFIHTQTEKLEFEEIFWAGIRFGRAAHCTVSR